jgi:transposase InsO family protein
MRNPFKDMTSQEFIGVIKGEAERRLKLNKPENTNVGYSVKKNKKKGKPSLLKRITNKVKNIKLDDSDHEIAEQKPNRPFCKRCTRHGHTTDDCHLWEKGICIHCKKFNHASEDCYFKDKPKFDKKGKANENPRKRPRTEEANAADSDQSYAAIEEVEEVTSGGITFDSSERGQYFNFENSDVANSSINDEATLYYDWLADSATTSHITNRRDTFVTFQPIQDTPITGVGGLQAQAEGRGDVCLNAVHNGITYPLRLCNVLYVPGNKSNLLSLGRWIAKGGDFLGRKLALISKKGDVIANGTLTPNNLIKFHFRYAKHTSYSMLYSYPSVTQLEKSWDVWHRRFGHIGYSGLRKTFDMDLVTGFRVERESSMPDCVACTEAKQSVLPFHKQGDSVTHPGDLTHIDVWGKYDVASINGHQYYLLMVDDASRYVTVEFLKSKDQATQKVINYITHLSAHDKSPKAIRIDRGREFVNETLLEWCYSRGMEVHMTAPHSPSQNGVAERMNRTLEDLARAMRISADLPVFLWEQAVAHAAYVRNRAYTSAIKTETPYQRWYGRKPDVSHLREFGTPVWILLQGQSKLAKMEPRSRRRALVGYHDGSKSVLYYNAETRKVLTSRNFRFLEPSDTVPERLIITPDNDAAREGEQISGTRLIVSADPQAGPSIPRKRPAEADVEGSTTRRTRGKVVDYKQLNDPFSEEEVMSAEQLTNLVTLQAGR